MLQLIELIYTEVAIYEDGRVA